MAELINIVPVLGAIVLGALLLGAAPRRAPVPVPVKSRRNRR